MSDACLRAWIWQQALWARLSERVAHEAGEGVISAAIAVLIMAFLGAAMWIAFKGTLQGATNHVNNQVNQIGR